MSISIKGNVELSVRDRRTQETDILNFSNDISHINFCGVNRQNGLFSIIATGNLSGTGTPATPNKLIIEMGNPTTTVSATMGLSGSLGTSASGEKSWGTAETGSTLKTQNYFLKASVTGSTATFQLFQDSDFTDSMLPVPIPGGDQLKNNPLGRRKVNRIRLNPESESVTTTKPGLSGAPNQNDVALVSGDDLPTALGSSVRIHNYSDIGVSYSLSLSDTQTSVAYGGFTDAYLNRLARVVAGATDLVSLPFYGAGQYWKRTTVVGGSWGASVTSIDVASVTALGFSNGTQSNQYVVIESEILKVTNVDDNLDRLTVVRAQQFSTADAYSGGEEVIRCSGGTGLGTKVDGAALFGAFNQITTIAVPSGNLLIGASTLSINVSTEAIKNALNADERILWLSVSGQTTLTYEQVWIKNAISTFNANTPLSVEVVRGASCTTPIQIDSGSTLHIGTRSRLSSIVSGNGWNDASTGDNYYTESGGIVPNITGWSANFGSISQQPQMIEYYTTGWTGNADATKGNFEAGREVAARFEVTLGQSFTNNDRVLINNFLGISPS